MKDKYFTSENIGKKSLEMLQKLETFKKAYRFKYAPEKSAFLILDMQRFFLDERSHAFIPSALPIIPRIKKIAERYIKVGLPVILTRHLNSVEDAGLMAQWWKDLITEKDELSEIIPELNLPDATLICKTQYDGFYDTSLESLLKEKDVRQLVITGVMTHLCCETTARSAFVRGFEVLLPIDGTATYNEDFHWATFLNLSHGFAVPVLTEELQNALESFQNGH